MIAYIDAYVSGPDYNALEDFASGFVAHIPTQQGRAAIPASIDAFGNIIPEIKAAGDTSLYYTCIRSTFDLQAYITAPMIVLSSDAGSEIVGIFAT